uniref:UBX domain-containing protein 4 n=1 Tax=Trichuris muris TaxID=70415 RepID=A0A5S6QIW7_TRIMR
MEVEAKAVWYEGDVTTAVGLVKQSKGTLIVLVYRNGNESEKAIEHWENGHIRSMLVEKNYVALKLEESTAAAKQFSSIYPVLSYPSTYFIRYDGSVLDVMVGPCKIGDLEWKIKKLVEKKPLPKLNNSNSPCHLPDPGVQSQNVACLTDKPGSECKGSESHDLSSDASKVEAKKVLNEIRAKKAEDERLREQLRKQIEADRREKGLRYDTHKEKQKAEVRKRVIEKQTEERKRKESVHARIQCRFPNGDRIEKVFDKTEKLEAVYHVVRRSMEKPGDFKLICLFSRQEYTAKDLDKSLQELGLDPSAVLLVLTEPKQQPIVGVNPVGHIVNLIYGWLLNPAWRMVSRVVGWLFPFTVGSSPSGTNASNKDANGDRPRRGRLSMSGSDDDDNNAVWNGNSTQQL